MADEGGAVEDAWGQGGRRSRGVADEGGAVAQLGQWPRAGLEGKAGMERASGAGTGRTQGPLRGGRESGWRIPQARKSLRRGFRRRSSSAWLTSRHPPDPPK